VSHRRAFNGRPTVYMVCTNKEDHRERRLGGWYWDEQGNIQSLARTSGQNTPRVARWNFPCPSCPRNLVWRTESLERRRPAAERVLREHGEALVIDVSRF
jgi:predicted RNA-binding Zn-ribbon protein involved in translation (DUF1610 family)